MFNRPQPECVPPIADALLQRSVFTCEGATPTDSKSAAAPATFGVACDVPAISMRQSSVGPEPKSPVQGCLNAMSVGVVVKILMVQCSSSGSWSLGSPPGATTPNVVGLPLS